MNDPSADIPFEHKVRLIMLVDDDPPCGAARNAGLIRSAGQIARDLAEGLEHHGVVKLDRVGIGGPAECERADNAAGRLRHGSLCVPKTLNPTIVVMKSAQDGA